MTDKKNLIVTTLIFILFFLFFPLNLKPSIYYSSGNSNNITNDYTKTSTVNLPFIYKDRAGYSSVDLKNVWSFEIKDGVTLMSDGYINSSRDSVNLDFLTFEGDVKFSIENSGYHFGIENRLFIISRDRKSLSEIVFGEIKWTKQFNYVITSIDASSESVVIGFVKGHFIVLNKKGKLFFTYEPGGSRVSIIYSIAISQNSDYLGVVSGLDPQRFILYQKKESEYKPIYSININEEMRKSTKIFITPKNKNVFVESVKGFYVIDIESKSSIFVETKYNLQNVELIEGMDIYMIHSGAFNFNNIQLITNDNRILLEKNFIGDNVTVMTYDKSIYTVIDSTIIELEIKEKW